jgi:hypothetical protein
MQDTLKIPNGNASCQNPQINPCSVGHPQGHGERFFGGPTVITMSEVQNFVITFDREIRLGSMLGFSLDGQQWIRAAEEDEFRVFQVED